MYLKFEGEKKHIYFLIIWKKGELGNWKLLIKWQKTLVKNCKVLKCNFNIKTGNFSRVSSRVGFPTRLKSRKSGFFRDRNNVGSRKQDEVGVKNLSGRVWKSRGEKSGIQAKSRGESLEKKIQGEISKRKLLEYFKFSNCAYLSVSSSTDSPET